MSKDFNEFKEYEKEINFHIKDILSLTNFRISDLSRKEYLEHLIKLREQKRHWEVIDQSLYANAIFNNNLDIFEIKLQALITTLKKIRMILEKNQNETDNVSQFTDADEQPLPVQETDTSGVQHEEGDKQD